MNVTHLPSSAIPAGTKWAFTTRRVVREDAVGLLADVSQARPGDIALCRIVKVGQHKTIQLAEGRTSQSYPGDHVVLACGDRYAPDQFEAVAELDAAGADLIAAGGLVGRMRCAHAAMGTPTHLKPLGLLQDRHGTIINVGRYGLRPKPMASAPVVIAVVGTSMNSGKTTATASLAHGLGRAGYRVAALKATGTGAFGDFNAYRDAGAHVVADFTDAGMASTYRQPLERIEDGFRALLAYAADEGADVAVVELADGVFQAETAALLRASVIRDALSGLMFAAPDALGAVGGAGLLREMGLEPFAISGMVSCSPLAVAEAQAMIPMPIVSRDELCDPERAVELVGPLFARSAVPVRPASVALMSAA